jgi:hypothetical protein
MSIQSRIQKKEKKKKETSMPIQDPEEEEGSVHDASHRKKL